jgi:hypothetical protein
MVLFPVHFPVEEPSNTAVQAGEVKSVQFVMTQSFAGHAQTGLFLHALLILGNARCLIFTYLLSSDLVHAKT